MSRSYKKTPGWTHKPRGRNIWKRFASKAVRKTQDIPDGRAYRRAFCSWNICDHKSLVFRWRVRRWLEKAGLPWTYRARMK